MFAHQSWGQWAQASGVCNTKDEKHNVRNIEHREREEGGKDENYCVSALQQPQLLAIDNTE